MSQDEEHLRLLSIFHYVAAGLTAFFALFPIIHPIFGLVIIFAPEKLDSKGDPPPGFLGMMMVTIAATCIAIGWCVAACLYFTGRNLAQRKHYTFCLVVAGIECLLMPYGTALGVFTLIVLVRESVKKLFADNSTLSAPLNPPST